MTEFDVSRIRTGLPNMSEDFYVLCEYYARALDGRYNVDAATIVLIGVIDDLEKGRCGFARKLEVPETFRTRKAYLTAELPNLTYFWDKFFPEVAPEFRERTSAVIGWNVSPLQTASIADGTPEYIAVAVQWWLDQVQHPKMDNGTDELASFMAMFSGAMRTKFDAEKAKKFSELFTEKLNAKIKERGRADLYVDYGPDSFLAEIGNAVGISDMGWPFKTSMVVTPEKVVVSCGYCAPAETLWEAKR